MKRIKSTAGQTRKTHKSRKTEPTSAPDSGPSSTALATTLPSVPPVNVLAAVLKSKTGEEGVLVPGAPVLPLTDPDPKTQWWYRPADSKARKIVNKVVVLRVAGHDDKEIAKRLKTTAQSVRQYVYLAHKNGWLDDNDEPVDIEAELAMDVDRKVVRNVSASLDGQMTNWQTHEMTIAAAKGRGIFKSDAAKGDVAAVGALPIVAIQVVMPPVGAGDQLPEIREDQMGGRPAYLDGEVDDVGAEASEGRPAVPGAEETVGTDA